MAALQEEGWRALAVAHLTVAYLCKYNDHVMVIIKSTEFNVCMLRIDCVVAQCSPTPAFEYTKQNFVISPDKNTWFNSLRAWWLLNHVFLSRATIKMCTVWVTRGPELRTWDVRNIAKIALPTSALQKACWRCTGAHLQASAMSSIRQRNKTTRVMKQLLTDQVILENISIA